MCGNIAKFPKAVGKTLWNQRLLVSSAIEGSIGAALAVIGTMALLSIVSLLSIGQIGSITLLVAGGALLVLASLSMAIKGGLMIKKRCSFKTKTTKIKLDLSDKIKGSDPHDVLTTHFKNLPLKIMQAVNEPEIILKMDKFEKKNLTNAYRVIQCSYGVATTWIIGIVTQETKGKVKWYKFEVSQMQWSAKKLSLTETTQNQLSLAIGPIKTKMETQDLLISLANTIHDILELSVQCGPMKKNGDSD